jgi:hypothetical protein
MKRWPYMLILAVLIAGVASSSIHNIPRITPAEAGPPMMQVVAAGGTIAGGEEVAECDSKVICQNFETVTTGYDNSESWTENGTVEAAYTTTSLRGDQSCQVSGAGDYSTRNTSITDADELWGHFIFQKDANPSSTMFVIRFKGNNNGTQVGNVILTSTGYIGATNGTSTDYDVSNPLSNDTPYRIWWHFDQSDGVMQVWLSLVSAGTTRPETAIVDISDGDAAYDIDAVALHANYGCTSIYDQVLIDDEDIASVSN